jgi:hypothetical protein
MMAHPQTPPRQISTRTARAVGLITPSTPRRLSRTHQKECPAAPFLPANMLPLPTAPLRTSPRTKKGDPTKSHIRTRTTTGDRETIIMPGMPPTPAETPVQKRQREQEMKRRLDLAHGGNTSRRLFPLSNVVEEVPSTTTSFDIYTDTMHREPFDSPNNPFAFGYKAQPARGVSPLKRKRDEPTLGPDEMMYTFRGKRFVRKVARGQNGESWREAIKPVRLFQKEINQMHERQRKRRRLATEEVEEVDTEDEGLVSEDELAL